MQKAEIWNIDLNTNKDSLEGELILESDKIRSVPAGEGREREINQQELDQTLSRPMARPGVNYETPEEDWPANWIVRPDTDPLLWLQLLAESSRQASTWYVRLIGIPYLGKYTPPEDTPRANDA